MKHKEAFALMNYKCNCGHHELIWNSRDGVTPFCIPCPICKDPMGMTHYNFSWDQFLPLYQVPIGDRYFADRTIENARKYAVRNVDAAISAGMIPEVKRNRLIQSFTENYYGEGNSPDILTKE